MRKAILISIAVLVAAAGAAVASGAASAGASSSPLIVAMKDPGCHWFYVGGGPNNRKYAKSLTRIGPVTLLNLTQFDSGDTFKLIYTVGEVIPGDVLNIGNPNCRVRVMKPIHDFINDWCQQGPCHHIALGIGDHAGEIESFAEGMGFRCVRI
jgi:hypothetical protein